MSLSKRKGNNASETENHGMWNAISGPESIQSIVRESDERSQLIYKHSPTCSVSFLAKQELEEVAQQIVADATPYIVDVIHQRGTSNAIASRLGVRHESPQVIILKGEKVVWKGSHWEIKGKDILKELEQES